MALILAIETATPVCSVALGRDGVLITERNTDDGALSHAEKVNVFIDEVMKQAGLSLNALDAVAVGIGPGSYTGLRIGLSAAKGLCHALDKPIIGIDTLATLVAALRAEHPGPDGALWPMIDARRMEVFTREHDGFGNAIGDVHPRILDEAWAAADEPRVVFGDGADKATALWANGTSIVHIPGIKPHARAMLSIAESRLQANAVDDLAYLVPLYGKEANVTQPGKRRV